jgi:hypothetical protein
MSNLSISSSPSPIQNFDGSPAANFDADQVWMVYNEYGELVDAKSVLRPQLSRDIKDVTQIMRLFQKVYHHDVSGNYCYLSKAIYLWISVHICL